MKLNKPLKKKRENEVRRPQRILDDIDCARVEYITIILSRECAT
jgi:hypothetical protein